MADPTPLAGFDRSSVRAFANRLDVMASLIATFAPDDATTDPTTGDFGYRGGRFIDDLGAVGFEPDGTIAIPNNVTRYVHFDPVNGVTIAAALDRTKFVIAEVSRGTATPSGSGMHIEDLRDINLVSPERMRWRGAYAAGTFLRNDVVSSAGVLYIANTTTANAPPHADWDEILDASATGSSLDVEDEGSLEESAVDRINFIGAGVTAVGDGVGGVDVTIPGGGSTQTEALKFLRLKWAVAIHENGTLMFKGFNEPALLGTASAPALSTSSFNASQVKTRQTSDAGTNNGAGRVRNGTSTSILSLGNAAGVGGYLLSLRFALITLFSGCRGFFGVTGTSPLAGTEPAATVNILGFGWSSSQTNFFLIHNDGSGAATEVDTSVAYTTGVVYEVEIDALPNSAGVTVRLYSVDADGRTLLYSATPSTNLPDGSAFLSPHTAINTGTQASAVVMDFHHWIADTR